MDHIILGGGLAGISLSGLLDGKSVILESEKEPGGLCRSFRFAGADCDIGPHILFSKNKPALEKLLSFSDTAVRRRSNKVLHAGKLVKYPFENGLSALPREERDYCLKEFLSNPYRDYSAGNMLQFFLKTFGEGITRLYLQPYNEKIWKFDPAMMDTQMVERIPRPPDEDIIKSARGVATEGYTHQLYFNYPVSGGMASLVSGARKSAGDKALLFCGVNITGIKRRAGTWRVETDKGVFSSPSLINCMPLHELFRFIAAPEAVKASLAALRYNSIHIAVLHTRRNRIGRNYALNIADRDIIFHRLSRPAFLGPAYRPEGGGDIVMAEITFRPGSYIGSLGRAEIISRVIAGLERAGLARRADVLDAQLATFRYAYVIYDLAHRRNADTVLGFLKSRGIHCCGRFAEFEYLNMDAVTARCAALADSLNRGKYGR